MVYILISRLLNINLSQKAYSQSDNRLFILGVNSVLPVSGKGSLLFLRNSTKAGYS